jgi:small basic protein (TIGR04137 family)
MSIHSSLKTKSGALNQHRNVLTRDERVAKLTAADVFAAGKNSPLGLPKVLSIKIAAGKKPKKDPAAADAAAPAKGAKGGAKAAAAPAAKVAAKPAAKKK